MFSDITIYCATFYPNLALSGIYSTPKLTQITSYDTVYYLKVTMITEYSSTVFTGGITSYYATSYRWIA